MMNFAVLLIFHDQPYAEATFLEILAEYQNLTDSQDELLCQYY